MASSKKTLSFIPRTLSTKVRRGKVSTNNPAVISASSVKSTTPSGDVSNINDSVAVGNYVYVDNDDDSVKETSRQQRWPNTDEPVCVMCGKFGEYICDETDEDVCSLQCKATHLASTVRSTIPSNDGKFIYEGATTRCEQLSEDLGTDLSFDDYYRKSSTEICARFENKYSQQQLQFFRKKFSIKTKGAHVPPTLMLEFKQCAFPDALQRNLQENDYAMPTPVQMQVIPTAMHGHDTLVSAATSSGKTASFLLPIIHVIHDCVGRLSATHEFCKHPVALILAPTRELCMQIEEQAKVMCRSLNNMKTCLLVGGIPLPQQLYRLRHKIQILIGTPGRINDVIDNHAEALNMKQIKMVVLDEVDVMLQMGFQNQIERIMDYVPADRQHMMFSATIPAPIEKLAEHMMRNPVFVSVGSSGLTNESVNQIFMWVEDVSKRKKLFSILCEPKHFRPPVLVFVESKLGADMLCEAIQAKLKISCESIHSDKEQSARTAILQNFLVGSYKVLISTSIIARGIDLPNVRQVIIFDMPKSIEDYVHQVGRAGRLHSSGFAMAFVNNENKNIFSQLKNLCERTGTKLPDQLTSSPHLLKSKEKEKKSNVEQEKSLKRKKWDEQEANQKSLLDILLKKRR